MSPPRTHYSSPPETWRQIGLKSTQLCFSNQLLPTNLVSSSKELRGDEVACFTAFFPTCQRCSRLPKTQSPANWST
ncbi:hypothetical protein CHARACLAT_004702 [Characodon lateralis]|uniref:Uncharacterized protein n=1 Tax=Characodon lateralis TaxID=208331 RepID=A0ABU7EGC9_9TELE|nr:hypothetical protein [Characodon lateralis]